MKDIITLNKLLDKVFQQKVVSFYELENIQINGFWVNEINFNYYDTLVNKMEKRIINLIDLDNSKKNVYFKIFHQDLINRYNEFQQINFENIHELKRSINTKRRVSSVNKMPKLNFRDCLRDGTVIKYEEIRIITEKVAVMFNLEAWDSEEVMDGLNDFRDVTLILENAIIEKLNVLDDAGKLKKIKEINVYDRPLSNEEHYLLEYFNEKKINFEKYYMYAYLSFWFDIQKSSLKRFVRYVENKYQFIKKLENFEEDKPTLADITCNDPNNLKLEFKINKMDVALFYRIFHDIGIIYVDNKNQKHPYTNLKKYIDSSNSYYLENRKVDKVTKINKEFAKFLNDNKYQKHEIELIELLLSKLNSRKEEIETNREEGLK